MKFPRCIRLDASDLNIYARAAEPGEWAVPGGFAFADSDPDRLERKARLAFHSAWLGTESCRLWRLSLCKGPKRQDFLHQCPDGKGAPYLTR